MKRTIGLLLFTVGLIASLFYGIKAYQDTESIKLFGSTITLSQADWTPLIISLLATVIGIILIVSHTPGSRSGSRRRR